MRECQKEIKERNCPRLCRTVSNDFRRPVKGADENRYGEVQEDTDQFCRKGGTENTEARSFFGALILFCTKILADKGGQRKGKTGDGKEAESFYLGIGAAAGNCHLAEFVNVGLDDDIGKGDDGILKAGGQSVCYDLAEHGQVKSNGAQGDPVFFRAFIQQTVKA